MCIRDSLNVIPLFIPSLCERKEDILYLAEFFLEKYSHLLRKQIGGLDHEVKNILLSYPWPGNVRELENAIEYAVNFERTSLLTMQSLPQSVSYTHLDVYKRQSIRRGDFRLAIIPAGIRQFIQG